MFPYFPIFHHCQNTGYLLNITFIFDRCCHCSAVMTPVKYESDSKELTGAFARSKISLMEKSTNGALVTPTRGLGHHCTNRSGARPSAGPVLTVPIKHAPIASFIGPTWGPSGADRTQVGPMLASWILLSDCLFFLDYYMFYISVDPAVFFCMADAIL